jgi:transcription elongation GreA/GreB family factor
LDVFEKSLKKTAMKNKIYDAAIKAQSSIVKDFQSRIDELKSTDKQFADDQHDSGSLSMSAEVDEQISILTDQLQMVSDELEKLKRIDPEVKHDNVHLGSVVVTDKERFFVSVSIERFKVGDVGYFGISTKAPVYHAMEGKKAGESFEVNGNRFEILEVL